MSVERAGEAREVNALSPQERYETEQFENKIIEFPLRKRSWIERGLEWGNFKRRDIIDHCPWIRRVLSVIDTAVHEMGHVYMIKRVGTFVYATVKPKGNSQGHTVGIADNLENNMLFSAGGYAAEVTDDQPDHSGCGSDRFKLRMMAQMSPYLSEGDAISHAQSITNQNKTPLQRDALGLAINETIAA